MKQLCWNWSEVCYRGSSLGSATLSLRFLWAQEGKESPAPEFGIQEVCRRAQDLIANKFPDLKEHFQRGVALHNYWGSFQIKIHYYYLFTYEDDRQKEDIKFPSASSLSKCLQWLGPGQTRIQELTRMAGTQSPEPLLLSPRVHVGRKLESGIKPRAPTPHAAIVPGRLNVPSWERHMSSLSRHLAQLCEEEPKHWLGFLFSSFPVVLMYSQGWEQSFPQALTKQYPSLTDLFTVLYSLIHILWAYLK